MGGRATFRHLMGLFYTWIGFFPLKKKINRIFKTNLRFLNTVGEQRFKGGDPWKVFKIHVFIFYVYYMSIYQSSCCRFLLWVISPSFIMEINGKNSYISVDCCINKTKQTNPEKTKSGIIEENLRHKMESLLAAIGFPFSYKFLQSLSGSFDTEFLLISLCGVHTGGLSRPIMSMCLKWWSCAFCL